ncbi:hypothetical protein VULLAG_LOCUS13190 [Vulpes lagopus]
MSRDGAWKSGFRKSPRNVYCVRALMWNSYKEIKRALYGLNYGLRLNPSHICTFIFRGAIVKSIINENEEFDEHEDHEKVYEDIIDFVFIEYAQLISILWMLQTSTILKRLISMTMLPVRESAFCEWRSQFLDCR